MRRPVVRRPTARAIFGRYAVAWGYLIAVTAAEIVYALLPGPDQAAVFRWASTNVHNLHHDPVGCMVVSAFFPSGSLTAWPALIALAMFGANHVLGNWRTVVVCASGHVIGTLVSEGIVGYRVTHGTLPVDYRYITDVGPSYVVVAAIAVAILYGGWLARGAAILDLALLVFVGGIFDGLGQLDVTAVGHTTSIVVAVLTGSLAVWQLRRARRGKEAVDQAPAGQSPAGQTGADQAGASQAGASQAGAGTDGRRAADQAAQPRPPA